MGALDKLKKINNKAKVEEVKIVQIDIDNVLDTNIKDEKDDKWDIATRENQEKISALEAEKAKQQQEESEELLLIEDEEDPEYHMEDRKYVVDGYGIISEISDSVMGNAVELIKVLEKARNREQWLYILDNALNEAFDITLIDYLFEHNYTIEEYRRNSYNTNSKVKKQSSIFYRFLKTVLAENNDEELIKLLVSVSFIDDRILEMISNNKDRNRIIRENQLLRFDDSNEVFNTLLEYEKKKDIKDFSYLHSLALNNINQEDIEKLISAGYVINEKSPDAILNNNEIVRKLFLSNYDQDILNLLITKFNNKPGICFKIYNFKNKEILTKKFMKCMGTKDFLNIIRYIEMVGKAIDIDRVIIDENIEKIKEIYKALNYRKVFNRQLFIELINLYETNKELLLNLSEVEDITLYSEQLYLLFNLPDKSHINTLVELENIEEHIYNVQMNEIEINDNILFFKDYICRDLVGESYLEVHKLLIELLSSNKLIELRKNILNENKKKNVDKYINLSLFLEGLVECDNINVLKNIASTVSECVYKTKIWNRDIVNLRKEIMELYTYEINEKMTDLNNYMTNMTFTNDNKTVGYVNIPNNINYNIFTYKVSYYGKTSNIKSIKNMTFNDITYQILNGISDEYGNMTINKGEVIVLYNKLLDESLLYMAPRELGIRLDSGILKIKNSTQMDAMPYRELVRNTKQLISNSCNEYVIWKDLLSPAGVLVFDIPTKEQIEVATYLNVPLVNIEQITNNIVSSNGMIDINYLNIKEEIDIEETITHENNNDQFLELFGSLLEIKGEETELPEAQMIDDEYQIEENGIYKSVLPIFKPMETLDGNIDVDDIIEDKLKSDIFKELLPISSINYEIKKILVDGEEVLSIVYDKIDEEEYELKEYDLITYFKKMAIGYLIGDPYDADTYQIKQDPISRCEQLFEETDLLLEYEEQLETIKEEYIKENIELDFIELIDYIGKIDAMDDGKYLCIFKNYIEKHNDISPNYLMEALLNKKHTLIKEIGEVIEYFTKALEESQEDK